MGSKLLALIRWGLGPGAFSPKNHFLFHNPYFAIVNVHELISRSLEHVRPPLMTRGFWEGIHTP